MKIIAEELLIRIDERTAQCQKDILEIKERVFGDGDEGLCSKMEKIETKQYELEKIRDENRKTLFWFGGILVGLFSLIVGILQYLKI